MLCLFVEVAFGVLCLGDVVALRLACLSGAAVCLAVLFTVLLR